MSITYAAPSHVDMLIVWSSFDHRLIAASDVVTPSFGMAPYSVEAAVWWASTWLCWNTGFKIDSNRFAPLGVDKFLVLPGSLRVDEHVPHLGYSRSRWKGFWLERQRREGGPRCVDAVLAIVYTFYTVTHTNSKAWHDINCIIYIYMHAYIYIVIHIYIYMYTACLHLWVASIVVHLLELYQSQGASAEVECAGLKEKVEALEGSGVVCGYIQ